MYWFISAILVSSAIFWLAPQKAIVNNHRRYSYLSLGLLFLPLIVLGWLLFTIATHGINAATLSAFGFVITACLIALPKLHRFIMPSALLTALALITLVLQQL